MQSKERKNLAEYHLNQHQPQKLQFAVHDLNSYIREHTSVASKPHIHSYYQIIWFRSGHGKHVVDFREYEVSENTIFFIAKNQVHCFDEATHYEGTLIHFNEPFLIHGESEIEFLIKCNLFNNPYQKPSFYIGNVATILDAYLVHIKEELRHAGGFAHEELLRTYLKAFLIQSQRSRNELSDEQAQPFAIDEKRTQLVRFLNLIETNYTKGLTVKEYATLMHISSRTLSDLTNMLLAKTPSLMIQERIILEAQRLLLHSNLNVNQIGYRLGFDDPSYFVKYFRKHAMTSPTEFRKAVGGVSQH